MRVAAYQAPLLACHLTNAIDLIRGLVRTCESAGVDILCCPEGVLGGLADYAEHPFDIAIDVRSGQLHSLVTPLASETVTTILGFTELGEHGRLFNAAAVFHKGVLLGVYRKLYPAINTSVYSPGTDTPVFTVGDLTFGIVICRDSTYEGPARAMASNGARALFVPTNNGLPPGKGGMDLVEDGRRTDITRATENCLPVIRADVTGRANGLLSCGSSGIVDANGIVLQAARPLETGLLIADVAA